MKDDIAKVEEVGRVGNLLVAVWHAIDERHIGLIAAGVAFYAMFAVFPGMAAMIAIWGFFADPSVIPNYMRAVQDVIPSAAYDVLETQLTASRATAENLMEAMVAELTTQD